MTDRLLFVMRQSPDWHSLSEDFRHGRPIDPTRFQPPVHIPGFPEDIVGLVERWNATMQVDFFTCRSRLKEMCEHSLAQIPDVRRASYLDLGTLGREIKKSLIFFHDDDDWFSPTIVETLREALPRKFDVCVFPLVRIAGTTTTIARQVGKPPAVLVGQQRPFSHRYQSNNYGINGRVARAGMIERMKDHVHASEYANGHGLIDVYVDQVVSITAKTPCSAQALASVFRSENPDTARAAVRKYVAGVKEVTFPPELEWASRYLSTLTELFAQAAGPEGKSVSAPSLPAAPEAPPQAVETATPPATYPGQGGEEPAKRPGVGCQKFIGVLADHIKPSAYLEIGTHDGAVLSRIDCDCTCVSPDFRIETNVLKKRRRAFFLQMSSDDFFRAYDIRRIFPGGVDFAFLNGPRRFELLLRDFLHTEKASRVDSFIVMRDCLPTDPQHTGRKRSKPGPWCGDVWKILPILKKYRPDLKVLTFDCAPSGLIVCTELDPASTTLLENYDSIVADFLAIDAMPADLHELFPVRNSRFLLNHPERLRRQLGLPPLRA